MASLQLCAKLILGVLTRHILLSHRPLAQDLHSCRSSDGSGSSAVRGGLPRGFGGKGADGQVRRINDEIYRIIALAGLGVSVRLGGVCLWRGHGFCEFEDLVCVSVCLCVSLFLFVSVPVSLYLCVPVAVDFFSLTLFLGMCIRACVCAGVVTSRVVHKIATKTNFISVMTISWPHMVLVFHEIAT